MSLGTLLKWTWQAPEFSNRLENQSKRRGGRCGAGRVSDCPARVFDGYFLGVDVQALLATCPSLLWLDGSFANAGEPWDGSVKTGFLQMLEHCHDLPMLSALACFASSGRPWAVAAFLPQRLSIVFSGLTSMRRRPPFANFGVSMRVFSDASFDYASVSQNLPVKKRENRRVIVLTLKEKPLSSRIK